MIPSDHDKKLYATALERLPQNGTVISWLKRTEMTRVSVADFPSDVLGALEQTVEFSDIQSAGFDDPRIAGSFESLTEAITSFCQSVDHWTLAANASQTRPMAAPPSGTSLSGTHRSGLARPPVSPPTIEATVEEETTALTRCHQDLVRAYDRFIRTAHDRGIDIDRLPSSGTATDSATGLTSCLRAAVGTSARTERIRLVLMPCGRVRDSTKPRTSRRNTASGGWLSGALTPRQFIRTPHSKNASGSRWDRCQHSASEAAPGTGRWTLGIDDAGGTCVSGPVRGPARHAGRPWTGFAGCGIPA